MRIPFKSLRYQSALRRTGAFTSSGASRAPDTRIPGRRRGDRPPRFVGQAGTLVGLTACIAAS